MKTVLVLEGSGHDPHVLQQILRDHGYAASEMRESDWKTEEALQNSEQRYKSIYDNAPVGIFRSTLEGKLLSVNPAVARMLKYASPRELVEMVNQTSIAEALYVDPCHRREILDRVLTHRDWLICEERFRCKDGSFIDGIFHIRAVPGADGVSVELEGFVEDISERKHKDETLRFTQFAIDKTIDQAFWMTEDARFFYVNDAACQTLGYSREELVGMSVPEIDPTFPEEVFSRFWQQLKEKRAMTFEARHRSKDGRTYPVEIRANYVVFDGKEYNCAFATDISERKAAEEALRESEHKYRSIIEHAPFGITRSTKDGKLLSVNPALASILKYDSAQELKETINLSNIQDVLFPKPSERAPLVEEILAGDTWYVFNNPLRCKDGSVVTCRVHSRRILDEDGRTSEFESYQENITDQLMAEQALRESEEKFRVLAETSPTAICIYQGESITYANPATERLFGYSVDELCRMKFWDWAQEDFKDLIRTRGLARLAGEPVPGQYEARYVTKSGEERCVLVSAGVMESKGQPTGVACFLDISERKRAEEQLKTSLGEKEVLLREIHHRVKNNLQVVSSLLYLQAQKFSDPVLQACFLESQNRICSMALAHEQLYQSKNLSEVSVKAYVASLVEQLCQIFHCSDQEIACCLEIEDIELHIEKIIPCGLLITELLSNAYKHAFVDDRIGKITISIKGCDSEMELSVADDGIGFPADIDYRQASTLGLQLVTALVDQLNGTLELDRSCGTLFRVRFPG